MFVMVDVGFVFREVGKVKGRVGVEVFKGVYVVGGRVVIVKVMWEG